MYFWKNGKKVKAQTEKFQSPTENVQRRRAPIREPYKPPIIEHYGRKKCPIWLYIVLICVAVAIIVVLIVSYIRSRKGGGRYKSETGASEKYGFRFF